MGVWGKGQPSLAPSARRNPGARTALRFGSLMNNMLLISPATRLLPFRWLTWLPVVPEFAGSEEGR